MVLARCVSVQHALMDLMDVIATTRVSPHVLHVATIRVVQPVKMGYILENIRIYQIKYGLMTVDLNAQ